MTRGDHSSVEELQGERELLLELVGIEQDIYDLAGETFNIKSSQQLGQILFEKLALPVVKKIQSVQNRILSMQTNPCFSAAAILRPTRLNTFCMRLPVA